MRSSCVVVLAIGGLRCKGADMSSGSKLADEYELRVFVSKAEHKFSSAHMTVFPDGSKEMLHGHNFHVGVEVAVRRADDHVMLDFSVLKGALASLSAELSERLLLPEQHPDFHLQHDERGEISFRVGGRRYVLPRDEVLLLPVTNVVVEQLAIYLWSRLWDLMRDQLIAASAYQMEVTVTESSGQGASYRSPLPIPEQR